MVGFSTRHCGSTLTKCLFEFILNHQKNQNVLKVIEGWIMVRKKKEAISCCEPESALKGTCCRVEALVTVDARGQVVLPKEVRDKVGIKAGDKFVLVSYESDNTVCCISLIKAEEFGQAVKDLLGPVMKEIAS